MPIPLEKTVELLENKANTTEAVLMCLIACLETRDPGLAADLVAAVNAQADAADRRGDRLAAVLLGGTADQIAFLCDLPGATDPEG